MAAPLGLCLEIALLQKHRRTLADTDSLTGLHNHRYFQQRLDEEIERANRHGGTLALIMFDLDNFKALNDTWAVSLGITAYPHPARSRKNFPWRSCLPLEAASVAHPSLSTVKTGYMLLYPSPRRIGPISPKSDAHKGKLPHFSPPFG